MSQPAGHCVYDQNLAQNGLVCTKRAAQTAVWKCAYLLGDVYGIGVPFIHLLASAAAPSFEAKLC